VPAASVNKPGPTGAPGWFGKLPALGDFASRRLPDAFVAICDAWIQQGLAQGQLTWGSRWLPLYLRSPILRFRIGPAVIDSSSWQGVLMPSVDRVGRYFPLIIAAPVDDTRSASAAADDAWYEAVEDCALGVLDPGCTVDDFEASLASIGDSEGAGSRDDRQQRHAAIRDNDRREDLSAGNPRTAMTPVQGTGDARSPAGVIETAGDTLADGQSETKEGSQTEAAPEAAVEMAVGNETVEGNEIIAGNVAAAGTVSGTLTDVADTGTAQTQTAAASGISEGTGVAPGESLWWERDGSPLRCKGLPAPQQFVALLTAATMAEERSRSDNQPR